MTGLDLGAAVIAARQAGILDDRRRARDGGRVFAAGGGVGAFHAFLDERLAAAAAAAARRRTCWSRARWRCRARRPGWRRRVGRLAPFGNGNEEPVLVLPRVRVVRADRVGREATTIRAFVEGEGGGARLKAMLFRAGDGALREALLARPGVPLHLAGHLRAEAWNGAVAPCFTVRDAALA